MTLTAFLIAGNDTSAGVISFGLYEISKNKDIERKLIEEADKYRNTDSSQWELEMVHIIPDLCTNKTINLYLIFFT